jgi:hypothetical protein
MSMLVHGRGERRAGEHTAGTAEERQSLLRWAGLSTGERAIAAMGGFHCLVDGTNGENAVQAVADTSAEAWFQAVEQARALGMLRR